MHQIGTFQLGLLQQIKDMQPHAHIADAAHSVGRQPQTADELLQGLRYQAPTSLARRLGRLMRTG